MASVVRLQDSGSKMSAPLSSKEAFEVHIDELPKWEPEGLMAVFLR